MSFHLSHRTVLPEFSRHLYYYWANVWTGTKRSSMTELVDEFGETYNFTEFANKIGVKKMRPVTGYNFPESVLLTEDFKLITNNADYKCLCLCKSFDVPLWRG